MAAFYTWMPDENLRSAVKDALVALGVLQQDEPLTQEAMQALTRLEYKGGIADLTGLEHATNLERLSLSDNAISDITPLTGLTNLRLLYLGGTDISDFTPLERLALAQQQIGRAPVKVTYW